ncbi:basigin-like [Rhineura floridana]|uniref:basigin-like n=1 Tax=Rhineura floridana TaxID=261503 RepID=UPI002AC7F88D|nr:basigin-like [Rhineura floridana]
MPFTPRVAPPQTSSPGPSPLSNRPAERAPRGHVGVGRIKPQKSQAGKAAMGARLEMLVWGAFLGAVVGVASGAGPQISATPEVTAGSNVIISCNISEPRTTAKGYWMKGETKLDSNETTPEFTSYLIPKVDHETSGEYHCIFDTVPPLKGTVYVKVKPHVVAYKKSEHGNEGDMGLLTCKSTSYPAVTHWRWFKVEGEAFQLIVNGSEERFFIQSEGNKTELRIVSLNLQKDPGEYLCNGTNDLGEGSALVGLRVRSRLAALWPFLGIVAEVLVLVTIIFIYEKRRQPNQVPDDDDGGSAPLKSNATNYQDKNVRQRNAN